MELLNSVYESILIECSRSKTSTDDNHSDIFQLSRKHKHKDVIESKMRRVDNDDNTFQIDGNGSNAFDDILIDNSSRRDGNEQDIVDLNKTKIETSYDDTYSVSGKRSRDSSDSGRYDDRESSKATGTGIVKQLDKGAAEVCKVVSSSKGKYQCIHGRQKYTCKDCGGSGICEHSRRRSQCKDCGGGSICEHNRIRSKCKGCLGVDR